MEKDNTFARLAALEQRLKALEDERAIRALLAWYCFGADAGRHEEFIDLFTEDARIEVSLYGGTDHSLLDIPDPNVTRLHHFIGRSGVSDYINSPLHLSIEGRSQHHMVGPPGVITVSGDDAMAETYVVVYAKNEGNFSPRVDFQSHAFARWKFRRVNGYWKISEIVRRRMGTEEQNDLLQTYLMSPATGPD